MPTESVPRPAGVVPVSLGSLAAVAGVGARVEGSDVAVAGATMSSKYVRPGDLFAAAPGSAAHGARYAADAVRAGAVAVLTDAKGAHLVPSGVPLLLARDVRAAVGPIAAAVYGDPTGELDMLGVTGTSGKTTTTFFVRAGLQAAGRSSGLIGTVATLIGSQSIKTGFTTPEATELQALLAVMRERGATTVAMEVSSHALALGRVGGVEFEVGAFTNLSEDHLDFHADMEDYFAAKATMFDGRTRQPVIVVDDEWGRRLAARVGECTTVSTGAVPADWRATDVNELADGSTRFTVHSPHGSRSAGCAVPGRYNVANAVLALAILDAAGVSIEVSVSAIGAATVPGRMERIDAGQSFLAIVDYSHKPAAVEGALAALRPLTRGRLIIALGCGGDRDRAKRPIMGRLAARDADVLIVTDDNPRSEDPAAIRAAMIQGALAVPAEQRAEISEIGDRAAAIAAAVELARAGDTVLIAGKGHEPGQEIAGSVHPFDDRDVLRSALESSR